ncbi:uncharacterized protein E5676_scaffold499G00530 [Cucumis melo var. makuwa]|uniref:Uncharacterized protein n=1 Tax=Cucumis melo var. makuwa TaxID=1194695 RepID=A0A5D3CDQ0_CUCMM|nr:uncharacterized protein E5676_scaffold499G00530 [Cucumis melo var. makuwa]
MMTPKKKEGEVHELSSTQRVATHVSSPIVGQTNFSPGYQNGGQSPFGQSTQRNIRNNWKQTCFDPIPMSYTELLSQLLKSHQVAIIPQEPIQPPYPKWYDPNAKCEYHAGAIGHSMENYFPLKAKVQSLVKAGWLKFKKTGEEPDVNQNPLPNHEGPAINVVNTFTQRHKNRVSGITTSMKTLFQILHGAGYLSPRFNNDDREKIGCTNKEQCLFHPETNDHSIEDCCEFKNEVQKLLDAKILLIGQMSMQEIEVNMITNASSNEKTSNETTSMWKPLVIHYEEMPSIMSYIQVLLLIRITMSFHGNNLKDVSKEDEVRRHKGKAIEMVGEDDLNDLSKVFTKKTTLVEKESDHEVVSKEEAYEFFKLIKQSEYKVIEQLHRTPARISMLSLFMYSELHHEEIPPEGTGHTKALHIFVKCKDHHMARVLVDNGSSLNIMSRSTLMKLPIDPSYLRSSTMVVRAFDGAPVYWDDRGFIQQGQSYLHYIKEGLSMNRYVSKTSLMIAKTMIKSSFQMHMGLEKDNQRDSKVISLPKAKEKFGLGYKPTASE